MPFVESFLTTIKNNKSIIPNKSVYFRKTLGDYKWTKHQFDFPKTSKEEIQRIRSKIQKQNRQRNFKLSIVFIIITIAIILLVLAL